jgi:hypothetical protein
MRHAIAKLIIFFIVSANLAWAMDGDRLRIAPESDRVLLSADQPGDNGFGHAVQKAAPCDHCCHGSAHYTGLPQTALSPFPGADCIMEPVRRATVHSLDKEPPLPPPNI